VHAPHGRLARVGLGHAAHSAVWDSQVFRVQATLHANNSLPAAKVRAKEPCVTLRVPQLRKCGNAVGSVVSKSDAVSAQARAQKLTVSTFTRRSPSRSFMALYFFLICLRLCDYAVACPPALVHELRNFNIVHAKIMVQHAKACRVFNDNSAASSRSSRCC
jgi:hypothetical protein